MKDPQGKEVDINWKYPLDASEKTALHFACEAGLTEITRVLLDHPDIYVNEVDRTGMTPFDLAVLSARKDCTELL